MKIPQFFIHTLAVNDFYWGDKGFAYPMGSVQLLGNTNKDRIAAHAPPFTPSIISQTVANHSLAWLLITEDIPDPNNRVRLNGEKIFLDYTNNNESAFNHLIKRWNQVLKSIEQPKQFGSFSLNITSKMTWKDVAHVAHQCGTCRFGEDPKTSVLDINCRTHDVDNLYIVDGSFFPSSGAVNPSLTIMANALRVGEHLLARLR